MEGGKTRFLQLKPKTLPTGAKENWDEPDGSNKDFTPELVLHAWQTKGKKSDPLSKKQLLDNQERKGKRVSAEKKNRL